MSLYDHKMISTKRGPLAVGGNSAGGQSKKMYLLSCKEANIPSACRWEELPHQLAIGRGNPVPIPLPDSWLQQTETGICSKGNSSSQSSKNQKRKLLAGNLTETSTE